MYELVIVIPIVREDFIEKCLETLYKYTDTNLFRVIVVDQTVNGVYEKIKDKVHFYIRPYRNLGFSKAANEGIIHGYRWGASYVGVLNDDTEFIHRNWWSGVKEQFETDPKILCVNPESPRVPLWGYGRDHGEYLDILPYKEGYSDEDWNYLLAGDYEDLDQRYTKEQIPESFPRTKRGVIDGIAMWFPIFKREFFDKVGLFSEHYYPGGGEDYDLNARAYSCAWPNERDVCDPDFHFRLVSSMKSWVWHHWGQSKDKASELPKELNIMDPELRWNDINHHWPLEMNGGFSVDPWGHWEDNGTKRPFKRVKDKKDIIPL